MVDKTLKPVITGLAAAALLGCATGAPVEPAPLASGKQDELRSDLVGQWKQTHRRESKDAPRQEVKYKIMKLTFNEDGTGVLAGGGKNPMTGGKTTERNDFQWYLEGRNIAIGEKGKEDVKYRVEEWSDDSMTLFNYPSDSYYIMTRVQ